MFLYQPQHLLPSCQATLFHEHFSVVNWRCDLFGRHEELSFVAGGRRAAPVTFLEDAPVVERARAAALLVRGLGRRCVDVVRVDVRLPQPRPDWQIRTVIKSRKMKNSTCILLIIDPLG